MRKQEDSRLSSSCSSIRSSNYSSLRPYTSALSTSRYSTNKPISRTSDSLASYGMGSNASGTQTLGRSTRFSSSTANSSSSPSTYLSRSTSASHKNLYTSPAAARVYSASNDSTSCTPTWTPSEYRGIPRHNSSSSQNAEFPSRANSSTGTTTSYSRERERSRADRDVGRIETTPTTRTHMVHPTSSHIRSRSSNYRTLNVAQFNQQARERAERDEKDRHYKEWMERENAKDGVNSMQSSTMELSPAPLPPVTVEQGKKDFRKKIGTSSPAPTYSSSYVLRPVSPRPRDPSPAPASQIDGLLLSTSYSTTSLSVNHAPPPPYSLASSQHAPPPPPPPPPTGKMTLGQMPSAINALPRSASAAVIASSASMSHIYKPTATVPPFEDDPRRDQSCVVSQGYTGLRNIGNTCFMNSVLQMLVNNIELREYFVGGHYKGEINMNNPLGFEGRLAIAFAEFMQQMWSGHHKAIEPCKIKEIVAEKASQFANFAQHDAHEFLSFLLDGLHEDVNRVKTKPLTSTVESNGRHDIDVSNEAWGNHSLRNNSIFVDLFHGQLKSHVQCPNCSRISITFDPFVYLPVPFPKHKRTNTVMFWPLDSQAKPYKMTVSYSNDGTVSDLLAAVGDAVRVPSRALRAIEVFGHRIDKIFPTDYKASDIGSCDVIYVFQVHDEVDCNEEVVLLYVVQRQLFPSNLRYMCNQCGKAEGHLKACDGCYNAYFCSKDCQLTNWTSGGHRDECKRRPIGEYIGQPLIVSFPRSQLTYDHLCRAIETRTRYTVSIFQAPQYNGTATVDEPISVTDDDNSESYMIPTAGPQRKRSGIGAPPSFLSPAMTGGQFPSIQNGSISRSPSPRRQSVLAEPRKTASGEASQKLFQIRKLNAQTDSFGQQLADFAQEDMQLVQSGTYLSIYWFNRRFGKDYITVANKSEIDVDVKRSNETSVKSKPKTSNEDSTPTLREMMELFSETERLKPEESWFCSNCKEHVEATKKLELFRLPPVLIVQLKRFVYTAFTYQSSMHRRSKDERRVDYPTEGLDMAPFLSPSAPDQTNTVYDLTGVVCHSGSSYFGHYISLGRLADFDASKTKIEWRQFDDSMVTRQNEGSVQSDDAYLLFYKLRGGSSTRSIFKKHYSCDPGAVQKKDDDTESNTRF